MTLLLGLTLPRKRGVLWVENVSQTADMHSVQCQRDGSKGIRLAACLQDFLENPRPRIVLREQVGDTIVISAAQRLVRIPAKAPSRACVLRSPLDGANRSVGFEFAQCVLANAPSDVLGSLAWIRNRLMSLRTQPREEPTQVTALLLWLRPSLVLVGLLQHVGAPLSRRMRLDGRRRARNISSVFSV